MSENSLLANICIALYPTLNNFSFLPSYLPSLFTYLLTCLTLHHATPHNGIQHHTTPQHTTTYRPTPHIRLKPLQNTSPEYIIHHPKNHDTRKVTRHHKIPSRYTPECHTSPQHNAPHHARNTTLCHIFHTTPLLSQCHRPSNTRPHHHTTLNHVTPCQYQDCPSNGLNPTSQAGHKLSL